MNIINVIANATLWLLSIPVAVVIHEIGHAIAATFAGLNLEKLVIGRGVFFLNLIYLEFRFS